jgi:hypothetical protein
MGREMHKEISIIAIFSTMSYMLAVYWVGGSIYSRLIFLTLLISSVVTILIPAGGFLEVIIVFSYMLMFLFLSKIDGVKYYSFIFILIFSVIFFENSFGIGSVYLIFVGILCLLFSIFLIAKKDHGFFFEIIEFLDNHVIRDSVFYFTLFSLSMLLRIQSGRV